jgi:hypothetical protein
MRNIFGSNNNNNMNRQIQTNYSVWLMHKLALD